MVRACPLTSARWSRSAPPTAIRWPRWATRNIPRSAPLGHLALLHDPRGQDLLRPRKRQSDADLPPQDSRAHFHQHHQLAARPCPDVYLYGCLVQASGGTRTTIGWGGNRCSTRRWASSAQTALAASGARGRLRRGSGVHEAGIRGLPPDLPNHGTKGVSSVDSLYPTSGATGRSASGYSTPMRFLRLAGEPRPLSLHLGGWSSSPGPRPSSTGRTGSTGLRSAPATRSAQSPGGGSSSSENRDCHQLGGRSGQDRP
jgi:hypothetical protein